MLRHGRPCLDLSARQDINIVPCRIGPSTGVLIGHYERDGEIKMVDGALDSPSKREIARQKRMKREG